MGGVYERARARARVWCVVRGVCVCVVINHVYSFTFLLPLCLPLLSSSLSSSPPSSPFPSGVIDKIDEFTDTTLHWLDEWLPLVKSLRILLVEARFGV